MSNAQRIAVTVAVSGSVLGMLGSQQDRHQPPALWFSGHRRHRRRRTYGDPGRHRVPGVGRGGSSATGGRLPRGSRDGVNAGRHGGSESTTVQQELPTAVPQVSTACAHAAPAFENLIRRAETGAQRRRGRRVGSCVTPGPSSATAPGFCRSKSPSARRAWGPVHLLCSRCAYRGRPSRTAPAFQDRLPRKLLSPGECSRTRTLSDRQPDAPPGLGASRSSPQELNSSPDGPPSPRNRTASPCTRRPLPSLNGQPASPAATHPPASSTYVQSRGFALGRQFQAPIHPRISGRGRRRLRARVPRR